MKSILDSIKLSFAMYSRISLGDIKFDNHSKKYIMAMFPLVGVLEGILYMGLFYLLQILQTPEFIRAGLLTAFPIWYTGGIHLDGFIDVSDALSSFTSREKKIQILKDPHTGAYAIIHTILYFIIYYSVAVYIDTWMVVIFISLSFTLIRIFSALSVLTFQKFSKGSVEDFGSQSDKNYSVGILLCFMSLLVVAAGYIHLAYAAVMVSVILLAFLYYRILSYKEFGGINGDLAGYFLQMAEILVIFFMVIFKSTILLV